MNKNQKIIIAGAAAAVAGAGVYVYLNRQKNMRAFPRRIWTTSEIPDLTDKVMIVSGANSGVGYEAAKEFARKGAQIILACRSMEKAEAALTQIQAEIPEAPVEIMQLNLASLESVRGFAESFKGRFDRLDVLLNNAGIMMVPYGVTEDGFERQFGTNHLGHFALTGLLIDVLVQTPGSRVVNVSSTAHRFGKMNFDNLMYEGGKKYSSSGAYGRSKLANLLFTVELQRRYDEKDIDAIAVTAHPGTSETNLGTHLEDHWAYKLMRPMTGRMSQPAAMGALPSIRAAVDPEVAGGEYFGPNGLIESKGYPVLVSSSKAAQNADDARQLWEVSETLTGVTFEILG